VTRLRTTLLAVALVLVTVVTGSPTASAGTRDLSATLPSLAELRSARIRLADLPGSYQRDYSPDEDSTSTSTSNDPECSRKLAALETDDEDGTAPRQTEAKFRLDRLTGPFVESSLAAWRTKGPAVDGMSQIRSLLRSCDQWTETDPDGTSGTVRLSRLAMPSIGSDRIALRARITVRQGALAVTVRADMAVVRVRNAVTLVSIASFGAPEGVNLVELARRSTTRLRAVV
jgi:hypothetical protein